MKTIFAFTLLIATATVRGGSYTNLAGNVSSGAPVAMTRQTVTLSNATRVATLNLSVFPVAERRRIVLDFARANPAEGAKFVRLPPKVEAAVRGVERRCAASAERAGKGLKTKEQHEAYCARARADLAKYLDRQVEKGVISAEERALWRK